MLYSMVRIFSDLLNARNQWCSIDLFCHSVHQYLPNEKFNQSLSKSLSSSMTESICFRPIRSSTGVDRSFSSTRVFNNFLSWTTDHENYSRFNAGHQIYRSNECEMLNCRYLSSTFLLVWWQDYFARRNSVLNKNGNFRKVFFQPPGAWEQNFWDCTQAHDLPYTGGTLWLLSFRKPGNGLKLRELLIVFISYSQQTQEKIQHRSVMVRQQTEFIKYVLRVWKDREK